MLMKRREFMRTGAMGLLAAPLASRGQNPLLGPTLRHVPPVVEIIPRSEWAVDLSPTGPLPSEEVRFLLVHHTASGNEYERGDVPALLRGFFEFHTSAEKGWRDIAYNFLIDRFGRVWEGRTGSTDGPIAGDATGGNQGYTQLVFVDWQLQQRIPHARSSRIPRLRSCMPGRQVSGGHHPRSHRHIHFSRFEPLARRYEAGYSDYCWASGHVANRMSG